MISWGSFLLGGIAFGMISFIFGFAFGNQACKIKFIEEFSDSENDEDVDEDISPFELEQNWRNN